MKDYSSSVIADISPSEAFEKINCVSDWWTANVQGNSRNLGEVFTVRFGETFVEFKIVEVIPDISIVWLVTDCNLHWIKNKTEWKDTKIKWELSSYSGVTRISMTHVGLAPDIECYNDCVSGWDFYVTESLLKLLTEHKGLPDGAGRKRERASNGRTEWKQDQI